MHRVLAATAATAAIIALSGCHRDDAPGASGTAALTKPTRLCRTDEPGWSCRDAREVEALIARDDLEIVEVAAPPAGIQHTQVLTLRTGGADPVVFRAKWRAHATSTARNSPRRELAAYSVQKLFLEPGEYVAPPAAPHCFPLADYRKRVDHDARATYPGMPCVYGVLSYWLEDVESLAEATKAGWFHGADDHALDPALFASNHPYRDSIARVNLFTYVIAHADSHARNFVITRDKATPHVYSVDNSLSLGMAINKRLTPPRDWSQLHVPALPRSAIDRLRAADGRLAALAAVAVLHRDHGRLVAGDGGNGHPPRPEARAPTQTGMDLTDGRLTIGLTADEIAGIRHRIADLLARIDRGELRVY